MAMTTCLVRLARTRLPAAMEAVSDRVVACADGPAPGGEGWLRPPFSQAAKQHAAELGIDLDDEQIQKHLIEVHSRRHSHAQKSASGMSHMYRQVVQ